MTIGAALQAASVIAIVGLVAFAAWKVHRAGRIAEKLGQAEGKIDDAKDAGGTRRRVERADPDERQRLRDKWRR